MSTHMDVEQLSFFLNGHITCIAATIGIIFNIITSLLLNFKNQRKVSNTSSKMIGMDSKEISSMLILTTPILSHNKRVYLKRTTNGHVQLEDRVKQPRIYTYFRWIIGCDTILLLSALMNYAIPTSLSLYNTFYAYTVPFW